MVSAHRLRCSGPTYRTSLRERIDQPSTVELEMPALAITGRRVELESRSQTQDK